MTRSTFVYVTYIRATPERVWSALTEDRQFMKQYWFGMYCESEWVPGAAWKMVTADGTVCDSGEILEAVPPRRLVIRWFHQRDAQLAAEGEARCVLELESSGSAVKLTITHTMAREGSKLITAVSGGWPKILSNLKSLLESGEVALTSKEFPK